MRPSFHPKLINDPFLDPGLFIPFLFEKRALLFDLGDLHALSSRDLLKVTHVFVTHTHMDHFVGFDMLLRIFLGREGEIHLFGPTDFLSHVEGKLAGYTWNLVSEYLNNFGLRVTEIQKERTLTKTYFCRDRFRSGEPPTVAPFSGILLKEPSFHVEGLFLDHRTPCLGLSLVENYYVSINKEALQKMGLPVGPWLTHFKKALYEKRDLKSDHLTAKEAGELAKKARVKQFTLFHFSPRYNHQEAEIQREALEAFNQGER
jgi:ribonuclease Z